MQFFFLRYLAMAALLISSAGLAMNSFAQDDGKQPEKSKESKEAKKEDGNWKPVLPEKGLEGWEITNFGGEGKVEVLDGVLRMARGEPLTGITKKGKDFPTENFEIRWSAQRVDGSDFFAGITFPVGKEYCSFICGGWGGGLVGISSINGNDASENESASYRDFKNGRWYEFKIRVDKEHITAWIDDEQVVRIERGNRRFSVRSEVMRSRPLGYCVFQSDVLVKEWEYQTFE